MQADNMLTNRKFGFCWQGRLDHEGHRSSLVWERMPSRPRPGDRFRSRWECGCESRGPVAARVRGAELPATDPRLTADSPPSFACYRRHRQRRQSTALTKKKRRDFLQALADGMSVTSAAAYAGLSRRYMYEIKDMDPEFAAAWDDPIEQATDRQEDAIRRRAIEGETEPVWYRGEIVGHVQKTSDLLKMFLMKARRPEYRDSAELEINVGDRLNELADAVAGKMRQLRTLGDALLANSQRVSASYRKPHFGELRFG